MCFKLQNYTFFFTHQTFFFKITFLAPQKLINKLSTDAYEMNWRHTNIGDTQCNIFYSVYV